MDLAYWTAIVGQQELGLSRDQIATLIKLDSESITRPNQGAAQWAKLLHPEGFPLINPSLKHAARAQSPCDQVLSEPPYI
jgi:hypothetical protein